jgi:hypothetical protein
MNKFQPGTVPVRVIYNPADLTKAAFTRAEIVGAPQPAYIVWQRRRGRCLANMRKSGSG